MAKEYYVLYKDEEIKNINACERCGSKRSLYIIPFFELISIECDNCGYGKSIMRIEEKKDKNETIKELDSIIEEALEGPDKEAAMYRAKAAIRKLNL